MHVQQDWQALILPPERKELYLVRMVFAKRKLFVGELLPRSHST